MLEKQPAGADLQGGDADARREAARLMGQASTEAKVLAARENGKRGGRPKGMVVSAETRRKISETKRSRNMALASESSLESAVEERREQSL